MRDGLLVRAAVGGVPGEILEIGFLDSRVGDQLLVVEDRNGVEILGQAVALAVLALPQIRQAWLILVDVEAILGERLVQRDQLLLADKLRVLGQVVGEDVGSIAGDEAVGELGPVVVPSNWVILTFTLGLAVLNASAQAWYAGSWLASHSQ